METWAIVDFSGYNYDGKFIVKEACIFQDREVPNGELTKTIMVTKPPGPRPTGENLNAWLKYLKKTGIKWNKSNCSIEELRSTLSSLVERCYVYVKNSKKIFQLLEFLGLKKNIRLRNAEKLGLYERKSSSTKICSFHVNRKLHYYCAAYNAKKIVDWVFGGNEIKCLVVDFNGYFFTTRKYELKEISIFGLNKKGAVVYHNLFVVPSEIGIRGSHSPLDFETLIKSTLEDASNVTHLFVKTRDHKKVLRRINKSKEILCLDDYEYKEGTVGTAPSTDCSYHTRLGMDMNLCADVSANKMVDWVIAKRYYDIKNLSKKTIVGTIINRELHGGLGFKFNMPLLEFHSKKLNVDEEL
ncbi:hypothetical protein KQX54_014535 [Cotesia glomerata]|uniref:Uncharacterized protein n=1 Tax=Cotesia glomerata TaxID=32391 RepID=A0AAV7HST7_COTGL|nr:hypothetical protein KQX54_014535 [Cotesia glomerata]